MDNYFKITHGVATILLLLIYLILAARMFRTKSERFAGLDRALAQGARLALLLVYFSGLVLSFNLGRIVHPAHYVIGMLPIVLLLGVRYTPRSFRVNNKNKIYAWLFSALFVIILLASLASQLNMLPEL